MSRRGRRGRAASSSPISARALLGAAAVLVLATGSAFTAANIVGTTNVGHQVLPDVPAAPVRPSECSDVLTTTTTTGSGVIAGTSGNDWLIGSEGIDTISGFGGDDCLEGKGGADIIEGGLGTDVCIGGAGLDTFVGCETQIQ